MRSSFRDFTDAHRGLIRDLPHMMHRHSPKAQYLQNQSCGFSFSLFFLENRKSQILACGM